MMEDEVAALVVDNGSGKSESTLECNKRAIVHFQGQTEIILMVGTNYEPKNRFSTRISILGQISGSIISNRIWNLF